MVFLIRYFSRIRAREALVREELAPERGEAGEERRVRGGEGGARAGVAGVDDGAVGEDELHRRGRSGSCSAPSRSTSRSRCSRRCRRSGRWRWTPGPGQSSGRSGASTAFASAPTTPGSSDDRARRRPSSAPALPAGELDEDRVGDGLPGEARAGRAEGERGAVPGGRDEEGPDLVDGRGPRHDPGHEPVEARVGAVGERAERIAEEPLRRERRPGVLPEAAVRRRERLDVGARGSVVAHGTRR